MENKKLGVMRFGTVDPNEGLIEYGADAAAGESKSVVAEVSQDENGVIVVTDIYAIKYGEETESGDVFLPGSFDNSGISTLESHPPKEPVRRGRKPKQ